MDRLAPIDVSNVLHGLASLGFDPRAPPHSRTPRSEGASHAPAALTMIRELMQQLLAERPAAAPTTGVRARWQGDGRGNPQALANSMWALATMSVPPDSAWMARVSGPVQTPTSSEWTWSYPHVE